MLGVSLFALVATVATANAQWTVASTESEFSTGRLAEHRHIEASSATGERAALDLAIFSTKTATLRVIDIPVANTDLEAVMRRESCVAGVNGGYFDPQYTPVGLLVSDGRIVAPQQKARLLSGVVSVVKGHVLLQRASEFSLKMKPTAARQCGPFLIDDGKAVPGLNQGRVARRTFIATLSGERAAIGYCSHVTLAELANLLVAPSVVSGAKVQRALNMDGGSSSGFWFAGEREAFSIAEQKTVRDYLAVVPR